MSTPVSIQNLGKHYRRLDPNRPRTLQEAVLRGFRSMEFREFFWALKDVSFSVESGEMLGVVGQNGAGKSTLLRLIGGVGRPDTGGITTDGKIGALIDLGTGFHPDLTGRENVFINGVISGLTRSETEARFNEIVRFAELQSFIDNPLRTYSTGMQLRLGFSVAAHLDPQILLVDEVLAVGDMAFQRKCLDRIQEFREAGCAVVLVSHNTGMVAQTCDRALWLQDGQVAALGPAVDVVDQYVKRVESETQRRTPTERTTERTDSGAELRMNANRFGSQEVRLRDVRVLNAAGMVIPAVDSGGQLQIELRYQALRPVEGAIFGVSISRADGFVCFDTSAPAESFGLGTIDGEGAVRLTLERLDLVGGGYYVDVGVYAAEWAYAYDYHWHAHPLEVLGTADNQGVLSAPNRWQIGE